MNENIYFIAKGLNFWKHNDSFKSFFIKEIAKCKLVPTWSLSHYIFLVILFFQTFTYAINFRFAEAVANIINLVTLGQFLISSTLLCCAGFQLTSVCLFHMILIIVIINRLWKKTGLPICSTSLKCFNFVNKS